MRGGAIVKQMRLYRSLRQEDLAEKMKVSRQRIVAIESAEDVNFSTIQIVAELLEFNFLLTPKEMIEETQDLNTLLGD